jgi:hypothetical protein
MAAVSPTYCYRVCPVHMRCIFDRNDRNERYASDVAALRNMNAEIENCDRTYACYDRYGGPLRSQQRNDATQILTPVALVARPS